MDTVTILGDREEHHLRYACKIGLAELRDLYNSANCFFNANDGRGMGLDVVQKR